jgi:hypothetical protein
MGITRSLHRARIVNTESFRNPNHLAAPLNSRSVIMGDCLVCLTPDGVTLTPHHQELLCGRRHVLVDQL